MRDDGGECFRGVALAPIVGMDRVADLDRLAADFGVVEQSDQLVLKEDTENVSVISLGKLADPCEKLRFSLARGQVRHHIGLADLLVLHYSYQRLKIALAYFAEYKACGGYFSHSVIQNLFKFSFSFGSCTVDS